MVAVISSGNLGVYTANGSGRGTPGASGSGQSPDQVYVNTTTGNLVIQQRDEVLAALGLDLALVRTYNSQGLMNDDNGDNWRLGVQEKVYGLTGTLNTAGSTIRKVFGDGADILYTYNATLAKYVSSEGDGASDTLTYSTTADATFPTDPVPRWTWTDGSGRNTEVYNASGQLVKVRDADGNTVSYGYANGLLTSITDASGQVTTLVYTGNNLTQIQVQQPAGQGGAIQTRTRYVYDTSNRLSQVIVDLTPSDNVITDGKTYVTTYTYSGTSTRVASITQGDGTTVSFTYELANGRYRVKTYTDGAFVNGMQHVTTLTYSAGSTTTPAPGSWSTAATLEGSATAATDPKMAFDSFGNGIAVWAQGVDVMWSRYTQANNTWTAAAALDSLSGTVSTPTLAMDAAGNAIAAWVQVDAGSVVSMYARRFDGALGTWGSVANPELSTILGTAVSTTAGVGAAINGTFAAISWQQGSNLYGARLNGTTWGTATLLENLATTALPTTPSVAVDSLGNATVVWLQSNGQASIYRNRFTAGGTWEAAGTLLESSATVASAPKIAFDSFGNGFAVWVQGVDAMWSRFTRSTGAWTAAAALDGLGGAVSSVALSVDSAGNALGAWSQADAGGVVSAYAKRFDVLQNAWDASTTLLEATAPAVATAIDGISASINGSSATVAWLQGSPTDLYVSRLVNGAWTVSASALDANTNAAAQPSVAIDNQGDVTVVWRQGNTPESIYQARFTTGLPSQTLYTQTDLADPFGKVTSYLHDSAGQLAAVIDANGIRNNYGYDTKGNLTSITEDVAGLARVTTLTYDANDNLKTTRDALRDTVTRTYNSANQLLTETRYLGIDPDTTIDGGAAPPNPMVTRYVYDETSGQTNTQAHLRFVISPEGRVTEYRYSQSTVAGAPKGALLATLKYNDLLYSGGTFTEANLVTWLTAAGRDRTQTEYTAYAYDWRGQLSTTKSYITADGVGVGTGTADTTQYVYDQRGQLLQTIMPRGTSPANGTTTTLPYSTTFVYDGLGRVLSTTQWIDTDPLHARGTTTVYDDVNNQTITTYKNGLVTTSVYDKAGQLITLTQSGTNLPGATVTTYSYDQDGQLRMVTSDSGSATPTKQYFIYDSAGRRTGEVDGVGALTQYVYNGTNQLVETIRYATLLGATKIATLATFTSANAPVTPPTIASLLTSPTLVSANDQIARNVYDDAGRLAYSIDQLGLVTQYYYDGANRLTDTVTYFNPVTIASTVAEVRAVAAELVAGNVITTRRFNNVSGTSVGTLALDAAKDRRTRNFYDTDGKLLGTLDGEAYLVENIYGSGGHLIKQVGYANQAPLTTPTNSTVRTTGTLSELRTAIGNDTETVIDPEQDIVSYFFYDGEGRVIGSLDGEGYFTETAYFEDGAVKSTKRYDRKLIYSTALDTFTELHAAAIAAPTVTVHTTAYDYNGAGQISHQVNYEGTPFDYEYDLGGNLTKSTVAKGAGTSDERVTQARYDVLGRVIQELSGENSARIPVGANQTQIDAIWTQYATKYVYDTGGRRVSATGVAVDAINGTQTLKTLFYYNEDGQLRYAVRLADDTGGATKGEITETRYNALGQVTDVVAYANRITNLTGLAGGLLTTTIETQLRSAQDATKDSKTSYTYTLTGNLKTSVTAEGNTVTNVYTNFGQLFTSTTVDATQNALQRYTYDRRGLTTLVESDPGAINQTLTIVYDAFGRVKTRTDQYNNTATQTYDRLGRVLTGSDAYNNVHTMTYDAFARVLTSTDALNNVTSYQYSDTTKTVTVTTPEGVVVTTVHNAEGQTVSVTAAGNTTSYTYDRDGSLTGVSDGLGALESRTYDSAGRQVTQGDANGIVTRFAYDAANRVLTRKVDPTTKFVVNDNPTGLNLICSYVYDGEGRLIRVTEPGNRVTTTSYDRDGRVTQVAIDPKTIITANDNPNGLNLITSYAYDSNLRTVTVTEGVGSIGINKPHITVYNYDKLGRRISETVSMQGTAPQDLVTQYKYDASGNVTRRIDANLNSTWYVYDKDNRLVDTIDALGGVTETIYDQESRVIATRRYATALVGGVVAAFGDRVTSVAPTPSTADSVQQSVYDKDGREKYSIDALGGVTERTFDENGNVIRTRLYALAIDITQGTTPYFKVLAAGTTSTAAAISAVTTALTSKGNNLTTVAASDRVQWSAYDVRGRLAISIDGANDVTQYQYDLAGQVTVTTRFSAVLTGSIPNGVTKLTASGLTITALVGSTPTALTVSSTATQDRVTRHWYDSTGRERFTLDGEGYLAEIRYDDAGRKQTNVSYAQQNIVAGTATIAQIVSAVAVAAVANNTGNESALTEYDAAGRTEKVTDAEGNYETYGYDLVGNRTSYRDKNGGVWTYEYDANERVLFERSPTVAIALTSGLETTANVSVVTAYTYDSLGNVKSKIEGSGTLQARTVSYEYDTVGRRTKQTVAMGSAALDLVTQYRYDTKGNLTRQIDPAIGPGTDPNVNSTWYVYDAADQLRYTIDALGGVTQNTFNATGEIVASRRYASVKTPLPTGDVVLASQVAMTIDDTADRVQQFSYDRLGRAVFELALLSGVAGQAPKYAVTEKLYNSTGEVIRQVAYSATLANGTYSDPTIVRNALTALGTSITAPTVYDHVAETVYDRRGLATFELNWDNTLANVVRRQYDANGNTVTVTAYATQYGLAAPRDAASLAANTSPQDRTTYFWYDRTNRVRFTMDAERYLTESRFNDAGHEQTDVVYARQQSASLSSATTATLAGAGSPILLDGANDQTTRTAFNALGDAYQIFGADYIAASNNYEMYTYDAVGNKTSTRNKAGRVWNYTYDANRRLTDEKTPTVDIASIQVGGTTTSVDLSTSMSLNQRIVTHMTYDKQGNVLTRTEAFGVPGQERMTSYEYDLLGRQIKTVLPDVLVYSGGDTDYGSTPTEASRSRALSTSLTTEVAYDILGNAYRSRDVAGNYSYKIYDTLGRVQYEVDAANYLTSYTRDTFGNQLTVTRYSNPLTSALPSNTAILAASAATSRLSTDANKDRTLVSTYDRLNRVTQVAQPIVINYEPALGATSGGQNILAGPTTTNEYNAFGQVIRTHQLVNTAAGGTYANTYFYYDHRGLKVAQIDPLNYLTTYEYQDSTGDLTRQTEYAQALTTFNTTSSIPPAAPTAGTNVTGYDRISEFTYDQLNRKWTETLKGVRANNGDGTVYGPVTGTDITTTYGYDAVGNQVTVTANGVTSFRYFDKLGRMTAVVEPMRDRGDGDTTFMPLTEMKYDALGNVVEQTQYANSATAVSQSGYSAPTGGQGLNRVSHMLLDSMGHARRTEDAMGFDQFAAYNERGDIAKEWQVVNNGGDPNSTTDDTTDALVTIYKYDALGQQRQVIEPQLQGTAGNVVVTRTAVYNAFGEIISKSVSGAVSGNGNEVYEYDRAGRMWRTNSGDGVYKIYLYNLAGQATAEIRPQYNASANSEVDLNLVNLDAQTNSTTLANLPGTIRTETVYDLLGRVREQREPTLNASDPRAPFIANVSVVVDALLTDGLPFLSWSPLLDPTLNAKVTLTGNSYSRVFSGAEIETLGDENGAHYTGIRLPAGLASGSYSYVINYGRPDDTVARYTATGTFTFTAGSNSTIALTSSATVGTVGTVSSLNVTASSANIRWVADTVLSGTQLQVFISGSWQTYAGALVSGTTYQATLPLTGLVTNTYQYRITDTINGRTEAIGRGTLQLTTASSTTSATVTPRVDAGSTVGTVSVAGTTLSWTGSLTGNTTAYTLTSQIVLTQGASTLTYDESSGVTHADNASTRTFSVTLPGNLASGAWNYTIKHIRDGEPVGIATGTINSSGPGSVRVVSSAAATPAAVVPVSSVTSSLSGSNTTMSWTSSSSSAVSAKFEYRVQGNSTWIDGGVVAHTGSTFSVTVATNPNNYDYRITESRNSVAEVIAQGVLTVTSSSSSTTVSSTSLTDAGTAVGPVSIVSGNLLRWTGATVGGESGYTLGASIVLKQGLNSYTYTVGSGIAVVDSPDGLTRTFTATLPTDLASGTWKYTISHLRDGEPIGVATGSISSSGPGNARQVSSISLTNLQAPPSANAISGVGAVHTGTAVNVYWDIHSDARVTGTLYLSTDNVNFVNYGNAVRNGARFEVNGLVLNNPATTTYYYRITDSVFSQELVRAVGTMTVTNAYYDPAVTVLSNRIADSWAVINTMNVSGAPVPQAGGVQGGTATATYTTEFDEISGQDITTYFWTGGSSAVVNWLDVGNIAVTVELSYYSHADSVNGIPSVLRSKSFELTNGGTGATLGWLGGDEGSSTAGWPAGGIDSVNYVVVRQKSNGVVLRDSTINSVPNTHFSLTAPTDVSYNAMLEIQRPGSSTWEMLGYMTRSGPNFIFDSANLPTSGSLYGFRVTQYVMAGETPDNISVREGHFYVSASSGAGVQDQFSDTPPLLSTVTVANDRLYWSGALAGGSVSVKIRNSSNVVVSTPTAQTGDNVNYSASLYNLPSGTYTYEIRYSNGSTYLLGTGSVTVSTTQVYHGNAASASAPSNTLYPIANVVPTTTANSSRLSWSYSTGGVASTVSISINGGAPQPATFDGSVWYYDFAADGLQAINYEIIYRRNSDSKIYAEGKGTFNYNATYPTTNSTLNVVAQPTQLPGVTNLRDGGSGALRWDDPPAGGLVQVRYRLFDPANFDSATTNNTAWIGGGNGWTGATPISGGYSFNFGTANASYEYEIQYLDGNSDQVRFVHSVATVNTAIGPANATVTQPSNTTYADVPITTSSNASTINWNYSTGGVATTVTVTINGVAQTPTFSGPGSYSFATNGTNLSYAYTVTYRRNSDGQVYAQGGGTFTYTAVVNPTNSVVAVTAQPTQRPGVTNLRSGTNGAMRWDDASNGGLVQVRYRVVSGVNQNNNPGDNTAWIGGGTGWTNAAGTSGAYSFDFGTSNNTYEYEIQHLDGSGNQVRFARGTVTVTTNNISTSVTPTQPSNLGTVTGFADLGGGYFGWTTAGNAGDTVQLYYRAAGAPNWVSSPLTATFSNGYFRVRLLDAGLLGDIDYQVTYTASTDNAAYRVGGGTVNLTSVPVFSGSNYVDTTTITLAPTPSTPWRQQEMDRWGNALSTTDASSNKTINEYNRFNQLTHVLQPKTELVAVDGLTGQVTTTPIASAISELYNYYDVNGRLVGARDGNGNINQATYNSVGQRLVQTNADHASQPATGSQKHFLYDTFGQVIQETDELGYRIRSEYDLNGRLIRTAQEVAPNAFAVIDATNPGGLPDFSLTDNTVLVRKYQYDESGRRIADISQEIATTDTYDESGAVTGSTQYLIQRRTEYWYDLQGNLIQSEKPGGGHDHYAYDGQGHQIEHIDANNNSQTWEYDYFGRTLKHKNLGGELYQLNYDRAGLLITQNSGIGTWVPPSGGESGYFASEVRESKVYEYDSANHLVHIDDNGIDRDTYYSYDKAARIIRQSTVDHGVTFESTRTEYDAKNRIAHLSGLGFSVTYSYDANDNRTHISGYYSSTGGASHHQDLWYQYDKMNRVTISQGVNVGGVVTIDTDATDDPTSYQGTDSLTQGTVLTYDARGMRTSATTYGDRIRAGGSGATYFKGATTQGYTYDGLGRLKTVGLQTEEFIVTGDEDGYWQAGPDTIIDDRTYDSESRVTLQATRAVEGGQLVTHQELRSYNRDGLLLGDVTSKLVGATLLIETAVNYNAAGDYDAVGNLVHYRVAGFDANRAPQYAINNTFTYRLGNSYQEATHTLDGYVPGASDTGDTTQFYNVNGELIRFKDHNAPSRSRYFVNNSRGETLTAVKGDYGDFSSTAAQNALHAAAAGTDFFSSNNAGYFFFAANGESVGSFSQLESGLKATFDVNYTAVSPSYPAAVPSTYVVQAGDTLRRIAMNVFGDAALWYVIAEANGISNPDETLVAGRQLTIPNDVISLHNDATSFKPFSVRDALGDTTPTQALTPMSMAELKHQGLAMFIGLVVSIIVTFASWGNAVLGAIAGNLAGQTALLMLNGLYDYKASITKYLDFWGIWYPGQNIGRTLKSVLNPFSKRNKALFKVFGGGLVNFVFQAAKFWTSKPGSGSEEEVAIFNPVELGAMGMYDRRSVVISAGAAYAGSVAGAAVSGIGQVGGASSAAFNAATFTGSTLSNVGAVTAGFAGAAGAIAGYGASYVLNKAFGRDAHFNWGEVAASAVGAGIASGLGHKIDMDFNLKDTQSFNWQNLVRDTVVNYVGAAATYVAQRAFGVEGAHWDSAGTLRDSFGNAFANFAVKGTVGTIKSWQEGHSDDQFWQDVLRNNRGAGASGESSPIGRNYSPVNRPGIFAVSTDGGAASSPDELEDQVTEQRRALATPGRGGLSIAAELYPGNAFAGYGYMVASGQLPYNARSNSYTTSEGKTYESSDISKGDLAALDQLGRQLVSGESATLRTKFLTYLDHEMAGTQQRIEQSARQVDGLQGQMSVLLASNEEQGRTLQAVGLALDQQAQKLNTLAADLAVSERNARPLATKLGDALHFDIDFVTEGQKVTVGMIDRSNSTLTNTGLATLVLAEGFGRAAQWVVNTVGNAPSDLLRKVDPFVESAIDWGHSKSIDDVVINGLRVVDTGSHTALAAIGLVAPFESKIESKVMTTVTNEGRVVASNSVENLAARELVTQASGPISKLEVVVYKESVDRAVIGDMLTGDHIPSIAAIRSNVETTLRRRLSKEEAITLRDNTHTVIVDGEFHAAGRTYFNKNTPEQIRADALDLNRAALNDQRVHLQNASQFGYNPQELQAAFDVLNQRNQLLFTELSTKQGIESFLTRNGARGGR